MIIKIRVSVIIKIKDLVTIKTKDLTITIRIKDSTIIPTKDLAITTIKVGVNDLTHNYNKAKIIIFYRIECFVNT